MSNMEKHLTWCHIKQVSLHSENKYIQQNDESCQLDATIMIYYHK